MKNRDISTYRAEETIELLSRNVDAVIIVDAAEDRYHALIRNGFFNSFICEDGKYKELIETLWFHISNTQDKIIEDYQVFIPSFGKFSGKYSKRLRLFFEEDASVHIVQMTVYPVGEEKYLFLMDEMDNSAYIQDFVTQSKVKTIQNTYLFSMYVDLVQNTTSSISITEISDETVHSSIPYTDWRMMIVNMIGQDDQKLFLERTDPEYLKNNFAPGRTSSFDCMMMNLEGRYIWVKLIFSRAETTNEDDFRFVFMVQNIHENSIALLNELKKYEELASKDALTNVYNRGRMETEIMNALDYRKKQNMHVSAMIFDIDHFKNVNDSFGHSVGDNTLKHFVAVLAEGMRDKNAALGRWGGEEFVAVCYDQNENAVMETAEQLRRKVSGTEFPVTGSVTCSIGITEIKETDTLETAFERMDRALYRAKSEGRNCVRVL
ncbi:MAG: GGDEF domain-containing protein [Oscillospiraceae bacterium]|nr:GGDEF domain-containing protein [Oscillospiraceae bacterium]